MTNERKGEFFILAKVVLWGLMPVMTILLYKNSLSPISALGWISVFASLFFALMLTIKRKWKDVLNKEAFPDILLSSVILGIVLYGFFFLGLKYTSAGNASIVALSEIFFTYLFFNIWKKEYFSYKYMLGAVLVVLGALLVLTPKAESSLNIGDVFVLIGSAFAPLGNFFQQRARKLVCAESIMFIRGVVASIFLLGVVAFFDYENLFTGVVSSFWLLLFVGFFIFGLSKIFWLEAIHKIPVTKAISILSIYPIVTIFFVYLVFGDMPTFWQVVAFVPMFAGVMLLLSKPKEVSG